MKRAPMKPELAKLTREGKKTETRRLINPQPKNTPILANAYTIGRDPAKDGNEWIDADFIHPGVPMKGPRYLPGEIIGIAEPWTVHKELDNYSGAQLAAQGFSPSGISFYADGEPDVLLNTGRYRQGRFLPDAFVRTKVLILGATAERVDAITEAQAAAEGVVEIHRSLYRHGRMNGYGLPGTFSEDAHSTRIYAFAAIWDALHPEFPFHKNPWVWRYTFELAP